MEADRPNLEKTNIEHNKTSSKLKNPRIGKKVVADHQIFGEEQNKNKNRLEQHGIKQKQ